jgi:hypothetical protein
MVQSYGGRCFAVRATIDPANAAVNVFLQLHCQDCRPQPVDLPSVLRNDAVQVYDGWCWTDVTLQP